MIILQNNLPAIVTANGKKICQFDNGRAEINDRAIAEKLVALGYIPVADMGEGGDTSDTKRKTRTKNTTGE